MKKTITTLTFAVFMLLGSTVGFAGSGIIISDKSGIIISDKEATTTVEAPQCDDGVIVFGREGVSLFGFVFGDDPNAGCTQTSTSTSTERQGTGIIISD